MDRAPQRAACGRDADRFDPDRFERDDDDAGRGVHMSFGVGPRVCIGASFATTEAVLILARLVRRYDVHVRSTRARCGRWRGSRPGRRRRSACRVTRAEPAPAVSPAA